jgi:hypothetical protein
VDSDGRTIPGVSYIAKLKQQWVVRKETSAGQCWLWVAPLMAINPENSQKYTGCRIELLEVSTTLHRAI